MFKLVGKLKNCRQSLSRWSKEEFGNNKLKLDSLKEELATIQSQAPLEVHSYRQHQIKKEIEILLSREKCFITKDLGLDGSSTGIEIQSFSMPL